MTAGAVSRDSGGNFRYWTGDSAEKQRWYQGSPCHRRNVLCFINGNTGVIHHPVIRWKPVQTGLPQTFLSRSVWRSSCTVRRYQASGVLLSGKRRVHSKERYRLIPLIIDGEFCRVEHDSGGIPVATALWFVCKTALWGSMLIIVPPSVLPRTVNHRSSGSWIPPIHSAEFHPAKRPLFPGNTATRTILGGCDCLAITHTSGSPQSTLPDTCGRVNHRYAKACVFTNPPWQIITPGAKSGLAPGVTCYAFPSICCKNGTHGYSPLHFFRREGGGYSGAFYSVRKWLICNIMMRAPELWSPAERPGL